MAIQIDYFLAADDNTAAATADLETGPRSESVDVVASSVVDPGLALGYLHEIVTGTPLDTFLEDYPPLLVAVSDDEQKMVLDLDPAVVTFLAQLPDDAAETADLAARWAEHPAPAEAEEWSPHPRDLVDFLNQARELAQRSAASGQGLYCWLWP